MEKDIRKKYLLVYKASTTPFFPANVLVSFYGGSFEKLLGKKLKSIKFLAIINSGVVSWFLNKELCKSAKVIYDKMLSSPKLLTKIQKKEKELSKILLKEIKTPVEKLFKDGKLSKTGEKKLKNVFNLCTDYGEYVDAPGFLFQIYLVDYFKAEILKDAKKKKDVSEDIFNVLLSSHKLTNYEKFMFDLLKTVRSNTVNSTEIKRIADRYFWLLHDYFGDIVDEKYVKAKLEQLRGDHGHLIEQFNKSKERINAIKKTKNELPAKAIRKIEIIQEILYLYNERKKEVVNQVNIFIRRALEYKFPGISVSRLRKIMQISPEDAIKLLKDEEIMDLPQRDKKWVYILHKGKVTNGPLKYLKLVAVENNGGILKGSPASPGKIKGRVSIVLNVSHMNKFKRGDILVAPYTSVNYLPVMHQAKAILTETGGLTSHAAIVSRELGKPSIVGIKNLIATLKDGDMIEVDADKGIVRILSKK